MKLEPSKIDFKPVVDRRAPIPEPPPVRLVAIEDMTLFAAAGLEVLLDDFYVNLLRFERESSDRSRLVYKSENFRLYIEIAEPPILRDDLRPIGIEVPSLSIIEHQLIERKIEYEFHRGLMAGLETLLLQDPARNWVQLGQIKPV
jgi:hypothetical protein